MMPMPALPATPVAPVTPAPAASAAAVPPGQDGAAGMATTGAGAEALSGFPALLAAGSGAVAAVPQTDGAARAEGAPSNRGMKFPLVRGLPVAGPQQAGPEQAMDAGAGLPAAVPKDGESDTPMLPASDIAALPPQEDAPAAAETARTTDDETPPASPPTILSPPAAVQPPVGKTGAMEVEKHRPSTENKGRTPVAAAPLNELAIPATGTAGPALAVEATGEDKAGPDAAATAASAPAVPAVQDRAAAPAPIPAQPTPPAAAAPPAQALTQAWAQTPSADSAPPVRASETAMPMRPDHIGRDMGMEIARSLSDGTDQLTVRLDPPQHGRVEVTLRFDEGGHLRATVSASHHATLDLLRRDAADLARALDNAGVSTDPQSFRFEGGRQDGNGQRQAMAGDRQDGPAAPSAAEAAEIPPAPDGPRPIGPGRLHMLA